MPALIARTARQADDAFALSREIDNWLHRSTTCSHRARRERRQRWLQLARRRALRYNRQHTASLLPGSTAFAPLACFRNFLREGREKMYFVALHDLPSAYDLFCCTYVETPADYRQEIHLHRESEELTLVVEGTSECVWYDATPSGRLREAGRVTANAFEAFRIPAGVPHSIDSRLGPNRNLTVKLSMFIEDRVGEQDANFVAVPKRCEPVTIDRGKVTSTNTADQRRYAHGHGTLAFHYVVDTLRPSKCGPSYAFAPGHYFLLDGAVQVASQPKAFPFQSAYEDSGERSAAASFSALDHWNERGVARIGRDARWFGTSQTPETHLFHVEGLEVDELLGIAEKTHEFPEWLVQDLMADLSLTPTRPAAHLEATTGLGRLIARN